MATDRDKRIAARMCEIYEALRDGAALGVSELGRDAITLAALRTMKQAQHIEAIERAVRLTGQGLRELSGET